MTRLLLALLLVACSSADEDPEPECEPGQTASAPAYCDEDGIWRYGDVSCAPGILISDQGDGWECTCEHVAGGAPEEFECESRQMDPEEVQALLDQIER